MKILLINHTGQVSGAERSLLDLARALHRRAEVLLVSPAGPLLDEGTTLGLPTARIPGTDGSLAIHPVHTTKALLEIVGSARALRRLSRLSSAKIVHANSLRAGMITALARPGSDATTVMTVRDVLPRGLPATASQRAASRGTDVVIANSCFTARAFRAAAPNAEVRVMYPPVDLTRFTPNQRAGEAVRQELGIPTGANVITVLAQITHWKRQDTAIEVLARLGSQFPATWLLLVGEVKFDAPATRNDNRSYHLALQSRIKFLELEDRVILTGDRTDVPAVIAATDVLLVPSDTEPFGRTVIEAMAMGCSVVATSSGGPAEVITDSVNGALVDPDDVDGWTAAVGDLLAAPHKRRALGHSAMARAREFDLDRHADDTLRLYESLCRSARAR